MSDDIPAWERVVRRLAAMDPLNEDSYYGCVFCGADIHGSRDTKEDHRDDCLWRCAKELAG